MTTVTKTVRFDAAHEALGRRVMRGLEDSQPDLAIRTAEPPSTYYQGLRVGFGAHDDDGDKCLALHADANERLAKAYGITGDSFPAVSVKELEEGLYEADTPYLTEALASGAYTEQFLLEQPLYPDQMVFLIGTFSMDKDVVEEGQCVANSQTGRVLMRMDGKKAQVLTETLTAVVFVISHIKAAGHPLSTMGEAAKHFIANWESEKYRKSMAGKKG